MADLSSAAARFEATQNGVSELLFAMYQMMIAIITPALIVGDVAERVKFSGW